MPFSSALLYIVFFVMVLLSLGLMLRDKYSSRIGEFILAFVLVLFSSLRYDVGRDYFIYEDAIRKYFSSHSLHMEWFWNFFKDIFYFFHLDFSFWFFIVAIVFVFLVFKAYKKQSYHFVLSLFLFVFLYKLYFESFNIIRQMMAMAVWVYILPCMQKKEYVKAMLLAIVTFLLHQSSVVMFLFLPFLFIPYSSFFVYPVLLLSLLVFPKLFKAILLYLVPYLPIDTYYIEQFMFDTQTGGGSGISYWINTLFAFYLSYRQKDLLKRDRTLLPYINSWYFVCFLSNSFTFFQVFDRFMYYMFIFLPILIANLFEKGNRYDRWVLCLFLFYLLLNSFKTLLNVSGYTYHYKIIIKDKNEASDFWVGDAKDFSFLGSSYGKKDVNIAYFSNYV